MNFDKLYTNMVKNCKDCNGTGTINKTERSIVFCHCMKFYIFAVRNIELGVPLSYVLGHTKPNVPAHIGLNCYFKNEQQSFNCFMNESALANCKIISATEMYLLQDFRELQVVLIYNLGLETFQNNVANLVRIMNEIKSRGIIGIFSFSIDKEKLAYTYPQSVAESFKC
jgi:hypothetical protein